jgi:hypothetical protein
MTALDMALAAARRWETPARLVAAGVCVGRAVVPLRASVTLARAVLDDYARAAGLPFLPVTAAEMSARIGEAKAAADAIVREMASASAGLAEGGRPWPSAAAARAWLTRIGASGRIERHGGGFVVRGVEVERIGSDASPCASGAGVGGCSSRRLRPAVDLAP